MSRYSCRNDNSRNKFAGRTNYGARLFVVVVVVAAEKEKRTEYKGERPDSCINSRRGGAEYFYPSPPQYVHMLTYEIGGGGGVVETNRIERTRKGGRGIKLDLFVRDEKDTERVNSCVVVLSFSLSIPDFYPPSVPTSAQVADLNIKGGLNLTYTTLNHVTSIGL